MGIRNYLIDGISGVGKTTVTEALERRGYHVIHGDRTLAYLGDPQTGEARELPARGSDAERVAWINSHWIWHVATVTSMMADNTKPITFFCGSCRNADHFIRLFDKVFVLEVSLATLKQRLANRPEDEFGGRPVEQELIARLHATKEDIPIGAVTINAEMLPREVVDEILARL
jgi:adenylate kinase family enzyme